MFDLTGRIGQWKFQRQSLAEKLFAPLGKNPGVPDPPQRFIKPQNMDAAPVAVPDLPPGWKLHGFSDPYVYDGRALFHNCSGYELWYRDTKSKLIAAYFLTANGWENTSIPALEPMRFLSLTVAIEFIKQYDRPLPFENQKVTPEPATVTIYGRVFEIKLESGWVKHPSQPTTAQQVGERDYLIQQCPDTYRWSSEAPATPRKVLQYCLCTTWVDDPAIRTEEHEARLVLADPKTWRWKPDAPETPEIPAGWKVERACDHAIYDCKVIYEKLSSDDSSRWQLRYRQAGANVVDRVYYLNCQGWQRDFPPIEFESFKQAAEFAKKHDREWPCQAPGCINVGELPPVIDGVTLPFGWKHERVDESGVKGKAFVEAACEKYLIRNSPEDVLIMAKYFGPHGWTEKSTLFASLDEAVKFVRAHDRETPIAYA